MTARVAPTREWIEQLADKIADAYLERPTILPKRPSECSLLELSGPDLVSDGEYYTLLDYGETRGALKRVLKNRGM